MNTHTERRDIRERESQEAKQTITDDTMKVKDGKNLTKQVEVNGKNITGRTRVCELDKSI